MLGISSGRMTSKRWRWRPLCGKAVRRPNGGRCNIYPVTEIERVMAARAAAAAAPPEVPDGFVDREGACRMFGVTWRQWKHWVTAGKVRCGVTVASPVGGCRSIYPIEALKKLREELFSHDTLYRNAGGTFAVPPGWSRRREAYEILGLTRSTWDCWQGQGLLPRGQRFDGGPRLYHIEDLKKLLEHLGLLAPPYPDPQQPAPGGSRYAAAKRMDARQSSMQNRCRCWRARRCLGRGSPVTRQHSSPSVEQRNPEVSRCVASSWASWRRIYRSGT